MFYYRGVGRCFVARGLTLANELVDMYVCGRSPLCLGGCGGMPPPRIFLNLDALRSILVHSEPTFPTFY